MKRKKSGSVAIPFLLTFLISLIIIGGIAMVIYDKINSDDSSLITMTNEAGTLSAEDNHTILLILDLSDTLDMPEDYYGDDEYYEDEYYEDEYYYDDEEEETYDWEVDETYTKETYPEPYTFIVMRSQPVDKKITFMGIQSDMLAGEDNKPVEDIYLNDGDSEVRNSLEYTLGIQIDRYMTFDSESFKKACNILGGVTFAVPKGISGLPESDGEQYLSPEQMEKIISFGGYAGGETQRISTASSLITAMINQTSGKRISENLDNNFETIINMVDSDISAVDYNNRKYAIKFMLKYSDPDDSESRSTRAQFVTPYGSQKEDGFIVDNYFTEDIKAYFDEYDPNNENKVQEENTDSENSENE
ncbi:LCP family glycopolymer transferase [Porcipelethomonas sp.]|uniref:LCP family glycopolymer transferase n=1 Tax=Porcipelethomonas sp. TaxID=2981675 RepID=UPI003EF65620